MPYETLLFQVVDQIATITINRPDKLNALNSTVIGEIAGAVEEVESRADVRVAIVTGTGRAFVAGADIGELARLADAGTAAAFAGRGQLVFSSIERSTKPFIAAVNGFALGGGCELAMACHVRIASETASFGQPEVKLGTIPGYGGTYRLPRLVGLGHAMRLLLTGEIVNAAEALRIGLVMRVVPPNELIAQAEALARQMAANAPLALARLIESVNRGSSLEITDALTVEATLFGSLAATADLKEGTSAFLERRKPKFSGH